jgi:peptidoglycan/LPS O-acetylase OafA/YrhL
VREKITRSRHSKRSDIQILRALSVSVVVLFHLNSEVFPFGYLGVDVFFVISGYLMQRLYSKDVTWQEFFQRRIKRLIPPLLITILIVLLFCMNLLLPHEFKEIVLESLVGLTGFSAPYYWSRVQYFSNESFYPFLHLWSVSVEVMYYSFFALLVIRKKISNRIRIVFALTSFCLWIFLEYVSPTTAFYSILSRYWEFEVGALIAILGQELSSPIVNKGWTNLLRITLTLVSFSIGYFLQSWNLFVVIISALIIFQKYELKLFKIRALVGLGNISYEIYLIHFPFIMLIHYQPLQSVTFNANLFRSLSLILGILLSAIILKESSFLLLKILKITRLKIVYIVAVICCLVTFTLFDSIFLKTYSTSESRVYRAFSERSDYRCGLLSRIDVIRRLTSGFEVCTIGFQFNRKSLLIGDSHADSIKEVLANTLNARGVELLFLSRPFEWTDESFSRLRDLLEANDVELLFVHNDFGKFQSDLLSELALTESDLHIVLIEPTPGYDKNVPRLELGLVKANSIVFSVETIEFQHRTEIYEMVEMSKIFSNVELWQTIDVFCTPICQYSSPEGELLYFDSGHLTREGARLLQKRFDLNTAKLKLLEEMS